MGIFDHDHHREDEELELLRAQLALAQQEIRILRQIERDIHRKLSYIKIAIGGKFMSQGPVTLTVGQKTKATVVGFDQNGAIFSGPIPPAVYTLDNTALDSSTPDGANGDDIVSLSAGVANLTATLTSAEGLVLSDTETITNTAIVPVLSSVKIDFA